MPAVGGMRRFLEDNLKAKEYEIVRLRAALPGGGGGSSSTDTAAALSGGTTDGSAGGQVGRLLPVKTHTQKSGFVTVREQI